MSRVDISFKMENVKNGRSYSNKKIENVNSILYRIIGNGNASTRRSFQQHRVFYAWDKIVGKDIAMNVYPVRFDFKTLYLHSDSPVWSNTLKFMEYDLIQKINAYVAGEVVTTIRFSFDFKKNYKNIVRLKSMRHDDAQDEEKFRERVKPNNEEERKALSSCERIGDEALKAAAASALSKSIAKKRELMNEHYHACPICGHLVAPERRICYACERRENEDKAREIRKILRKKPWLTFAEIANILNCDAHLVMAERMTMIHNVAQKIEYGDTTSEEARMLVMLVTKCHPEDLTAELMQKTLKRFRYDQRQDWDKIKREKSKNVRAQYGERKRKEYLKRLRKRNENKQ